MNVINLVQNDTGPDIKVALYDPVTNSPFDLSNAGTSVKMHYRAEGSPTVTTINGVKTNGGADGVVSFAWPSGALSEAGYGDGEFEITLNTGMKQTVPTKARFYVREEIA